MSHPTIEDCYRQLVDIYMRSADPGWEKMKTFLNVGEKGGIWSAETSFVYYPGKEPETFSPTWYDAAGELLEQGSSGLLLALWGLQNDSAQKWYAATFTVYPDGRFEFTPSIEEEKTFSEVSDLAHMP